METDVLSGRNRGTAAATAPRWSRVVVSGVVTGGGPAAGSLEEEVQPYRDGIAEGDRELAVGWRRSRRRGPRGGPAGGSAWSSHSPLFARVRGCRVHGGEEIFYFLFFFVIRGGDTGLERPKEGAKRTCGPVAQSSQKCTPARHSFEHPQGIRSTTPSAAAAHANGASRRASRHLCTRALLHGRRHCWPQPRCLCAASVRLHAGER